MFAIAIIAAICVLTALAMLIQYLNNGRWAG
jgi:hypothetical protein